jgi:C-terminal processing protease CtpA/Prc
VKRALFALVLASCHPHAAPPPEPAQPPRVANLHAFARLYGVVRWFHPSDAAAAVDWSAFAIDGARRVIDAPDAHALEERLAALFAPIAPTVRIAGPGESLADDPALHPAQTAGLDVVAWEHQGFGDSVIVSAYHSKRRHRARTAFAEGEEFAAVGQSVAADAYRGRRVRLRAKVRADAGAAAQLWLRIDRPNGNGFFDNMDARPIRSTTWTDAEIVGTVDADAVSVVAGALVSSNGAWYDDVTLEVEDAHGAWQPIELVDPGFESADPIASWHVHPIAGWTITAEHDHPASGAAALHIARATTQVTDELFDDAPAPGETIDLDLGRGLRARVPIALYSKDGHTLGDDPAAVRASASAPARAGFDPIAGAADVIVAWNVLEHFWPYWDVVQVDWNAELDTALAEALADHTIDDHVATLSRLAAAAPDGHASVVCPGATDQAPPAIALDWVEGQVVVAASGDDRVKPGDVVLSIDGRSTADALAARLTRISGSPQWRQTIAMYVLLAGPRDTPAALRLRRGADEVDVSIARSSHERLRPWPKHAATESLAGGVWYVDLSKITGAELDAKLPELAAAPAVIFDLRGYPTDAGAALLPHLIDHAENAKWMSIERIIRPDHAAAAWDGIGWNVAPVAPHVRGRVAFLTGAGAISYAESVMGYVAGEQLGAIVGEPTAGTNGNIAEIAEPTGCNSIFTGMRVTGHDGARHHLRGVQPTITATRTIAGVRAGKDEVLDAALAAVTAPR